MDIYTISSLKRATHDGPVEAPLHAQLEAVALKETRDGKPFYEMTFADAEAHLTLRVWSDAPAFPICESLTPGMFLEVHGWFSQSAAFGVESKHWTCRPLSVEERDALLGGPPAFREKQGADFAAIQLAIASVLDPRLRALADLFLLEYGARFRRAAAARANHHARRGGLVEHVAQMLRAAVALSSVYPLNRDLLIVGVLFHDAGKLWENALPADGFQMPFDERGELLGHLSIGIELINGLWRKLLAADLSRGWPPLQPPSDAVRLHLLHLVAAHHGDLQYGSPVHPKTPEAWALHYIDNLDAKLEMLAAGYLHARPLAPHIQERVWPLPGNLVRALPAFEE